jgi:hypothetical protein
VHIARLFLILFQAVPITVRLPGWLAKLVKHGCDPQGRERIKNQGKGDLCLYTIATIKIAVSVAVLNMEQNGVQKEMTNLL